MKEKQQETGNRQRATGNALPVACFLLPVSCFLLLSGCLCSDEKKRGGTDAGQEPLPLCDPPLSVEPAESSVRPLDIVRLQAAGGTGEYRYEVTTEETGGFVDERNGNYLAGENAGTDTITVTDDACDGEATATVTVGAPFAVRPLEVELPPGGGFTYEVTGGSGSFSCELVVAGSGATVTDACRYTAGDVEGDDVVAVTDTETADEIRGVVRVRDGARIVPDPPRIAFPVGQTWALDVAGGSGVFDVEASGAAATAEGTTLTGASAGRSTVTITDHFTRQTAEVVADVVSPQRADLGRVGDFFYWGAALGPGDVDGDGSPDAILGLPEADVDASNSGAVYVWAGGPDGLSAEPARVFSGREADEAFGRGTAVADIDGDGLVDIAVGAPGVDRGGGDSGEVRIWRGVSGEMFEEDPWTTLSGPNGWDNFGYAVAACDFDGDGRQDVAVGAPWGEERAVDDVLDDQGVVHVYRGTEDGFAASPDQTVYGKVPDGAGGWIGSEYLRFGYTLAAGDVDGDGLCDLAVGNFDYNTAAANDGGAVHVYRGDAEDLLGEDPAAAWAGTDAADLHGSLGRNLSVGDLDGDGRAEIAASEHGWNGGEQYRGIVRVFSGRALDGVADGYAPTGSADFSWEGNQSWDQVGYCPVIADANVDGRLDLLSGNLGEEALPEDWAGQGTVAIFDGIEGALPAASPSRHVAGLASGDAFGQAVAALGDVDADGEGDLLVFAGSESSLGWYVGRPFFVSGDSAPVPLEMPGQPAGHGLARTLAILGDVTGDGREDLIVGAPDAEIAADRMNAGAAYLYRGAASGFEADPAATYGGFPGNDGWERFGTRVASAGDFDGDGIDDFAVIARYDDRPDVFDETIANPLDCPGRINDSGAVYVFRGVDGGVPANAPDFVWFGPAQGQAVETLAGDFDFDGDGRGDLAMGVPSRDPAGADNAGSVAIVAGRDADPAGTVVICDSAIEMVGVEGNGNLGYSLAAAGDVDGDGCDEVVVGAVAEDLGQSNQGTARVIFGWGASCARASAEAVTLVSEDRDAQAGYSVAGAGDVDGDGIADLAIGGIYHWEAGEQVGAAWVVPGSYLSGLPREAIVGGRAPTDAAPMFPGELGWQIEGRVHGEQTGRSVAFVPEAAAGGRDAVAVGAAYADIPGVYRAGGVRLYAAAGSSGIDPMPIAAFGGETRTIDGRAGDVLSAGMVGGRSTLVVGGYRMDAVCLDCGAAFVIDLDTP